jgi:hypothetical protein
MRSLPNLSETHANNHKISLMRHACSSRKRPHSVPDKNEVNPRKGTRKRELKEEERL